MGDLAIARRWLGDHARALLGWSTGVVVLVSTIVATYPAIRDNEALNDFARDLPEFLQALVGDEFTSPVGYLGSRLFTTGLPVLFIVYVVGRAANAIAGDEEAGRLELLLAEPVTRGRVVLERALAIAVAVATLGLVAWVAVIVGGLPVDLGVPAGDLLAAVISTTLLALTHGAVALAVGAATGRRGAAVGAASGVAFGGWLVYGLAPVVSAVESVRWLSPWDHALRREPLRNGFDGSGSVVLVSLAVALVVTAVVTFDRRDVGT